MRMVNPYGKKGDGKHTCGERILNGRFGVLLLATGFVFAGEPYGGSGNLGYFTAYTPSATLKANTVAADASTRISAPGIWAASHRRRTNYAKPSVHPIGRPLLMWSRADHNTNGSLQRRSRKKVGEDDH